MQEYRVVKQLVNQALKLALNIVSKNVVQLSMKLGVDIVTVKDNYRLRISAEETDKKLLVDFVRPA